jgi:hypothetical protein
MRPRRRRWRKRRSAKRSKGWRLIRRRRRSACCPAASAIWFGRRRDAKAATDAAAAAQEAAAAAAKQAATQRGSARAAAARRRRHGGGGRPVGVFDAAREIAEYTAAGYDAATMALLRQVHAVEASAAASVLAAKVQADAAAAVAAQRKEADGQYVTALQGLSGKARDAAAALRGVGDAMAGLRQRMALSPELSPLDPKARMEEAYRQLSIKLDAAVGGAPLGPDILERIRAGEASARAMLSTAISSGGIDAGAAAGLETAIEAALAASRNYYADLPRYGADYDLLTGLSDDIAAAAGDNATAFDAQVAAIDRSIVAMGGQTAAVDRSITSMGALQAAMDAARAAWVAGSTAGIKDTPQEAILRAALAQSGHAYTGGFAGGDFARFAMDQMAGSARNWGAWDTTAGQYIAKAVAAVSGYNGDFANGQAQAYLASSAVSDIQREAAREVFRRAGMVPTFSTGGDVAGGIPGVDSVLAMLTPGEKVFSVDHTRMLNDIHRAAAAPSSVAVHIDVSGVIDAVTVAAANTNRVIDASARMTVQAVARLEGEVARLHVVVRDQSREIRDLSAALRRAG